jgi:hypothetical protein
VRAPDAEAVELVYAWRRPGRFGLPDTEEIQNMPTRSSRYRGTDLQHVESQHDTAVGRLVMLHRLLSADDKRRLLADFPELAATLDHLDRCDAQIAVLTVGTRTEDTGLGR